MDREESLEDIFADEIAAENNSADSSGEDLFAQLEDQEPVSPVTYSGDGVLTLGKTKFAIGLTWNTVFDEKSVSKEARAAAKSDATEADFFCTRVGESSQYGLGYKSKGHKSGMPALAAAIDDILEDDWVAVFPIGGNFYLAASRDELILSEYDRLFSNEEEAREAFTTLLVSADWDKTIAPKAWELEGTDDVSLESLEISSKLHRLRAANPTKNLVRLGVIIGVIGGLAIGANMVMKYYENKEIELARQLAAARAASERVDRVIREVENIVEPITGIEIPDRIEVEQPPNPPWFGKRNGLGELITCAEAILETQIQPPGFRLSSISCANGSLSYSFMNNGGTATWAESYLIENDFPNANLDGSVGGGSIFLTKPAPFVSTYAYEISTTDLNKVRSYLLRHFEETRETINWEIRQTDINNIIDRYYEAASFSFETQLHPSEYASLFSKIKAFEISNITYNPDTLSWQIQGAVYHKRLNPIPRPVSQ